MKLVITGEVEKKQHLTTEGLPVGTVYAVDVGKLNKEYRLIVKTLSGSCMVVDLQTMTVGSIGAYFAPPVKVFNDSFLTIE